MNEQETIVYALDYTMPWVIDIFREFPEDQIYRRPNSNFYAPAFIIGHIAVTERRHVGQFLLAIDDIPAAYAVFDGGRGYCEQMCTEEELRSTATREEIIAYWEEVHRQTLDYLNSVTDADLATPPQKTLYPDGGPDRNIPRRDWLIKLIEHQSLLMGQLLAIKRLYENEQ